jgi:hypothetical protein
MSDNTANQKGEPMNRARFILVVLWMAAVCGSASAYDGEHGDKNMVVGGYLSTGLAMTAGDGYEQLTGVSRNDRTAKFAVGGDAYFDYYFTPMFGIEAGLGFHNKGIRFSFEDTDEDLELIRSRLSFVYMEIPVCFKFDIHHFQGTVGFSLFFALSGKQSSKFDNDHKEEDKLNGSDWQYYHRVNFGPKLEFSYAIPVGPVFIVPGISWSIHLINDFNNDELHRDNRIADDEELRARANILMANIGVEWGF